MPRTILAIECIGDDQPRDRPIRSRKLTVKRPWVAEILGIDQIYGYQRQFLRGQKDYSQANSVGSRGVYRYYFLDSGKLYEVFHHVTWKRTQQYFCHVVNAQIITLTRIEAEQWLSDHLVSTFSTPHDNESA